MTTTSVTTRQPERNGRPANQVQTLPGRAAGPQAGGGAQSGPRSNANNVSASDDQGKRRARRTERDRLRGILNRVSSLSRCRNCGWAEADDPRSHEEGTGPQIASRGKVAYWRGVQTCGSIHACPVCGAKVRNKRAIQVSLLAKEWIDRGELGKGEGGEVYMITLTARHMAAMLLANLLALVSEAFRSLLGGRAWFGTPERPSKLGGMLPARPGIRERLNIAGTIRSLEITFGKNGWHVHLHVLCFVRGVLGQEDRARFELYWRDTWEKWITHTCRDCGKRFRVFKGCPHAVSRVDLVGASEDKLAKAKAAMDAKCICRCKCGGRGYEVDKDRCIKIERCYSGDGAGKYITKLQESGGDVGNEMTRSDMKKAAPDHWMPFDLLDGAGDGDKAFLKRWHEFEQGTRGRQCITMSPELRRIGREWLGEGWLKGVKADDAELAAEDVDGDGQVDVTPAAVRQISRTPGLRTGLLDAWEDRGVPGVLAVAAEHGLRAWPACGDRLARLAAPASAETGLSAARSARKVREARKARVARRARQTRGRSVAPPAC